jgi:hypothetical protein
MFKAGLTFSLLPTASLLWDLEKEGYGKLALDSEERGLFSTLLIFGIDDLLGVSEDEGETLSAVFPLSELLRCL